MTVLVGADPEIFIARKGEFMSGHGVIPGTKRKPFKVNKGAVQVDGMALEFNIDPAASADDMVTNIHSVMNELRAMVPEEFDLLPVPVAFFSPEVMKVQPREALELGCEPDFNAYTMTVNPKPDGSDNMRTAAGHVHVGFVPEGIKADARDPMHFEDCATLIRQLDFYLGLPSVLYDEDVLRKEKYGKAGAFRPKPYGAEYRVLSNFWLKEERFIRMVWNNVQHAVNALKNGEFLEKQFGPVEQIINSNDKKAAEDIIKKANIPLCA